MADIADACAGGGGDEELSAREEDTGPEVERCDPCRHYRARHARIADTCRGGGMPRLDTYRGRYRVRPVGGICKNFEDESR